MKKVLIFSLGMLMVLSSCGTYEGAGAYTGAQFGSIIGSAIGGISGGWRGHHVGTLVGMAGGAVVGAAIGKAADQKVEERAVGRYIERRADRQQDYQENRQAQYNDDIIDFDGRPGTYPSASVPSAPVQLEISNVQFVDTSHDGLLARGESARVSFEIYNCSSQPYYGVQPSVTEVTGNKHIYISENILVECIMPGQAIRYTAQVKADRRLKDGMAIVRVGVFYQGQEIQSQLKDIRVRTIK